MTTRGDEAEDLFEVETHHLDGVDLVVVSGEMDLSTTSALREVVLDPAVCAQPVLLMDLQGVRFIDSTGVACLVICHRRARARDARLVLACGEGIVLQILTMVGLAGELTIVPDAAAHLASLGLSPTAGSPAEVDPTS